MTPTPEQPQQKLEDYLKSCNDREYAEYIIATMTHGNSPSDFDKIQKEAIQAIRSRPHSTPQQHTECYIDGYRDGARKAREDVLKECCAQCPIRNEEMPLEDYSAESCEGCLVHKVCTQQQAARK